MAIVSVLVPVESVATSFTCLEGPQQVDAAQVLSLAGQSKAQLSVSLALSSPGSCRN